MWAAPGEGPPPVGVVTWFMAVRLVQGWAAIVALGGIADRFWNRDHARRPMLAEAVFPFYIIHQTVIVLVGSWLLLGGVGPFASFALLVAATLAGRWPVYLGGGGKSRVVGKGVAVRVGIGGRRLIKKHKQ